MSYEGDPIQFTQEGYAQAEDSTGFAGDELVEKQWAVMGVTSADASRLDNENKTLRIHVELTLAPKGYEKDALTPGRKTWHDLWIGEKKGGQQMLDAFLLHTGVGMPTSRFSTEPTHDRDARAVIPKAQWDTVAAAIATALEKKLIIGHVGVEVGGERKMKDGSKKMVNDRNTLDGHHRLTDENLEAIRAAGYRDGAVVKKSKVSASGRKVTFLQVKPTAAAGAQGGAGASVAAAGTATSPGPEAPRTIGA